MNYSKKQFARKQDNKIRISPLNYPDNECMLNAISHMIKFHYVNTVSSMICTVVCTELIVGSLCTTNNGICIEKLGE